MARNALPDREYVRECLDLNSKSGVLRWRQRPLTHFPNQRAWKWWNTKWAGKIAGTYHEHGYIIVIIGYQQFRAHRLVWLLTHGEPVPEMIDNIDGDPRNNRITNLRSVSMSENLANQRLRKDSSTGIKGVRLYSWGKYGARVTIRGKTHHLGSFATLEEATAARREAAERLHGEFARHE